MTRTLRAGAAAIALIALAGCTTMSSPDPRDPWEPLNRATFEFNDGVDRVLLKPVAEGYRFVMPDPARTAVTNFFSNLNDPWVALNQLMQGKVRLAIDDFGRFVWNSTIGLLGLIDVATDMGLPKHKEHFGQTMGVWGVGFGPYFVVPILGPSSVRDAAGLVPDAFAYLPWQIPKWADFNHRVTWQWSLTGLDLIQTRANLLDASSVLEEAALDRYAFVRDAYFQRRRFLIYDGDPPPLPAKPESSWLPPAGPVAPGAISLVPAGSPPPVEAAPASAVSLTTPGAAEAARSADSAQTDAEPSAEPAQVDAPELPREPARESEASPLAAPPSIGPLVEPKIPANYPAVLAADAPRVLAAR